jgi:hypothetical protein
LAFDEFDEPFDVRRSKEGVNVWESFLKGWDVIAYEATHHYQESIRTLSLERF